MNDKKLKHVWMIEEPPPAAGQPPKSFWTKIGIAFENDDGSLSLVLAAIPVTGKMVIKDAAPLALGAHRQKQGAA